MGSITAVTFAPDEPPDPSSSAIAAECVVDLSGMGEVVGIEILNLASTVGMGAMRGVEVAQLSSGKPVRFSYDADSDALYVRIGRERSLDQAVSRCILTRGASGRLLRIDLEQ